jgi:aminoglycoside 3'-phosphotransferase-2
MDYIDGISLRHFLGSTPNLKDREKIISHYGLCLKQVHESQSPAELHRDDQSWLEMIKNTLIHGDFHTNNVLVNYKKVVGIIDWPRASYGDPRFDISLAIRPKQDIFDQKGDKELFFESYGRLIITEEEYRYFQEGLYKFF